MQKDLMFLSLIPHIRKIVYTITLLITLVLYYVAVSINASQEEAFLYLTRVFGLTALAFLFLTLTPGLVQVFFRKFPLNPLLIKSRRALGVSTFFFATLHGMSAFINNFGGSYALIFSLPINFKIAVFLGYGGLFILSLLALTSFDKAIAKLGGKKWKMLHRFVYLCAILVVVHAFLIGSHFTDFGNNVARIVTFVSFTYLVLEIAATIKKTIEIRALKTQLEKKN